MLLTIDQAVEFLRSGEVVVFPTETVYGLGAVASNLLAVENVYKIKNRPRDNPLICHFYDIKQIRKYAKIPELTKFLMKKFCPGPISFLLDITTDSPLLPATCGLPTMVARIPSHPLTLELLRKIDLPLVGPSANTSGKFSGTDVEMIQQDLGNKIAGILDGGKCQIGMESTIIDARDNNTIKIFRQGIIGKPELAKAVQKTKFRHVQILDNSSTQTKMVIPGSKYKHYAPITPIIWVKSFIELEQYKHGQTVIFGGSLSDLEKIKSIHNTIYLGERIAEIAKNFYRCLFDLDQKKVTQGLLFIPILDNSSISLSLMDKINKIVQLEN